MSSTVGGDAKSVVVGDWKPTPEQVAAIKRAAAETGKYVFEGKGGVRFYGGVQNPIRDALRGVTLLSLLEARIREIVTAWRDWDPERPDPFVNEPPPDWWDEVVLTVDATEDGPVLEIRRQGVVS